MSPGNRSPDLRPSTRRSRDMRAFWSLRRLRAHSSALVIAVGASAPSAAGRVIGSFTLPVAAEWGDRLLPAADYTIVVSSATSRAWVYVRGGDETAVFFAESVGEASRAPMNELCLVYDGYGYRVRSLKLRDAGRIFFFDTARTEALLAEAPSWSGVLSVLLRPLVGPG